MFKRNHLRITATDQYATNVVWTTLYCHKFSAKLKSYSTTNESTYFEIMCTDSFIGKLMKAIDISITENGVKIEFVE